MIEHQGGFNMIQAFGKDKNNEYGKRILAAPQRKDLCYKK